MILRRLRLSILVAVLATCFLVPGATRQAGTAAAPAPAQSGWVFEGCWTYWPAGPCEDVFRDSQGNYWLCRACGTTGTPGPTKCSRISPQTLAIGYWCS
jgi:hypothetical protein